MIFWPGLRLRSKLGPAALLPLVVPSSPPGPASYSARMASAAALRLRYWR
jgi:hypothetical protein